MFDFSKISQADVAKVLLLSLYFVSGVMKFMDLDKTAGLIKGVGLPYPKLVAFLAASLLVIAPVIIIKENRNTVLYKYSVHSLIAFTAWATYLFHNVIENPNEKFDFMKNISIIGGLLLI